MRSWKFSKSLYVLIPGFDSSLSRDANSTVSRLKWGTATVLPMNLCGSWRTPPALWVSPATCLVTRDHIRQKIHILCNFQDLKENLKFSVENTINSRKYGKILSFYTGNTSFTDNITDVFPHAWPHKTKINILCNLYDVKENLKISVENTINSRKYGKILSYTGNAVYYSDVNNLAPKLDNSVQIVNKITGHARRRTREVG